MPELSGILTVTQCARRLGVKPHTVRRLYREKQLRFVRLGRRTIVFLEADVQAFERARDARPQEVTAAR